MAVFIFHRATGTLDAAAIAAAAATLSDEERAQFNRFHFTRDARDYAAAHDLLRRALSRDRDVAPERWRFVKDARGKPFLSDEHGRGPSFSLSHTRGMVACAIANGSDIGVDVECIDREVDAAGIAARFFAPAEAAQLATLDGDARRGRFFELWTLKEALAKALGIGMAATLDQLAFTVSPEGIRLTAPAAVGTGWEFALNTPDPRYRLAVAVRRAGAESSQLIFRSHAPGA